MPSISTPNEEYNLKSYTWKKLRDCLEGSDTIKRAAEEYLPIPSGFLGAEAQVASSANNIEGAPWKHNNPAYQAYMMRARFPDCTALTLRGLVGTATKKQIAVDFPGNLNYLQSTATTEALTLEELYSFLIGELSSIGKHCLILDVANGTNQIYISTYRAESNIDWSYGIIDGVKALTRAVFATGKTADGKETHTEYLLGADEKSQEISAFVNKYVDSKLTEGPLQLSFQGKKLERLPIVMIGAEKNTAKPGVSPLAGLAEIALTMYRKDADLAQGHFQTCNPTLIMSGVDKDDTPTAIGSTVIVTLPSYQAKAYYTTTDTAAFDHISGAIEYLKEEASQYSATFMESGSNQSSGEALKIRQASSGATLIKIVRQVESALIEAISIIQEWTGSTDEFELIANSDFADKTLSAQEITSLNAAYAQGTIDLDSIISLFRAAGFIAADATNEEVKASIQNEPPAAGFPIARSANA